MASRGAATAQQSREFDRAGRLQVGQKSACPPTPKKAAPAIDAEAAGPPPPRPWPGRRRRRRRTRSRRPDLSDLAAAAAAADDTHPGLDLPLLTFSCIAGIKLSQATHYLRSRTSSRLSLAQGDCGDGGGEGECGDGGGEGGGGDGGGEGGGGEGGGDGGGEGGDDDGGGEGGGEGGGDGGGG